jgi:glutamyl-tRNA synthetase
MIKTRFAPSPTGVLHVGGARTALFCWLLARKASGKFVLRIEDTDLERSTPESVQAILDGMAWLGLEHDEGPFYQTRRFDRYREIVEQLISQGDAYYCQCSRERLDALREKQMADRQKPRYDGCCRDLGLRPSAGSPMVVRFCNPQQGVVSFLDHVKGEITVDNRELDDLIIARGDGSPTYNLSVVVDDMDMQITHVLRGDDHVNNTPRQINILRALGAPIPEYAHVPMILGDDGKRLSKRHGAVGVMEYHEAGYLPQAMLNYLVRLGWSHGDQEIFSREEMVEHFALDSLNRSASSFNTEKLNWVNQHYLMHEPLAGIVELVRQRLERLQVEYHSDFDLDAVVDLYRQRAVTINALVDAIEYFFRDFDEYDSRAAGKVLKPAAREPLERARERLAALESWNAAAIHAAIEQLTGELGVGMGKIGQPLRVAVTGGSFSPPIDQTLELLGRQTSLARVDRAIEFVSTARAD